MNNKWIKKVLAQIERIKDSVMQLFSHMRSGIEFLGKHPFAIGMVGTIGTLGVIVSLLSYRMSLLESKLTAEQIIIVKGGIKEVIEHIHSSCSSPPCWSLKDLLKGENIGRSKDLIDVKLPPAENIEDNQYLYLIEGCEVRIEYQNNAVTYISSALKRYRKHMNNLYRTRSCPFDILQIRYPGSDTGDITDTQADFPSENSSVTLRDLLRYFKGANEISNACLECGNYTDPYIEAYQRGGRSSGSIDFYFLVSGRGEPEGTLEETPWYIVIDQFKAINPDRDPYGNINASDHCGIDITKQLDPLMDFTVDRVGIGRGPRAWSGPRVFFCDL